MPDVHRKDVYFDAPSNEVKRCDDLCREYKQACLKYCKGTHESWPLILMGIGLLALILIVGVVYAKRFCLLYNIKKLCGRTCAPYLKYPDQETGFSDQTFNLLPVNNYTGDQSRNDIGTNDFGSRDHDIIDEDASSNYAAPMPAIKIEPSAPPEEAIDNDSAAEDETGENIACGSNTENVLTSSQKEIHFQNIRVGKTIPEHYPPQSIINTVGNSNTNTAEHYSELIPGVVLGQIAPEPANWTQAPSEGTSENVNTQETLVIATRELENVLSQQATKESGLEINLTNNLSDDPRAFRRMVETSEQGIPDSGAASARADTSIDMTISNRSCADTGPAEKQVMRPRYEREDSRQEVR